MIDSRHKLKETIKCDTDFAYVPKNPIRRFFYLLHGNEQCHALRYVLCLRHYEYHLNCGHRIRMAWYHFRLSRLGLRYGLKINPNCVDKGLNIIHLAGGGGCIINCKHVGEYFRVQSGVVIGVVDSSENAPEIGNYVSFGLGSKAFGKITIGDYAKVLPNAIVSKDVPPKAIVGGVPAKVIRYLTEDEVRVRQENIKN